MQDIVREILSGNQERFREIVRQYSADMLRIAYHFVHDWDEAQDLTQDSLIRCFQSLRRYDLQRPFRPWLYRIHLNVCRAAARRRQRRRSREIAFDESRHDLPTEIRVDDSPLILQQIARLPMRQKAAFILIEIEGLNSSEAAYILGCADSTLRVHLARARLTLRENLTKLGIGYGSVY